MAKGEWQRVTRLINAAKNILDVEAPMTIRQLFYRLVSAALIPNDRKSYQLVSRIVTKARDDGRISFSDIVDRSRPEYSPSVWNDTTDYADTVKRGYRRDYWHTQPNYVELWVEKDAILGSIKKVTDELGVTVRVGRGFLSTTKAHEIARHFARVTKPITVFYLGDHDPSGHCIESDFFDRIQKYGSGEFELRRLAIFAEDIKTYNLPPLRVKPSDARAAKFMAQHGEDCVELDALPPDILRERIKDSVEEMLDFELWNRAVEVESVEMASIKETVGRWQNIATADASEFRSIRDGI